ncbi:large conductance mechanosensitive channel protein MscL [Sporosarcina thermotolerans]|uniref:Large-conductance mechanosensitive channel n=1 Tax=Sporosarcina thermotolerans TaxID=633404 RepID=A0AAW9AC27_9BACL|nr:large conductance mechanosensitive channel protein MscL [Sporosarcina thermotolerans]MDW0116643.1 large conductance mechanosensitive channel protein MscL [Sporosarcina thermotolerans]
MWKDFKEFAFKGNVLDLAIAVVIGGAFGKIVSSLVENIITPLLVALTGKVDVSKLHLVLGETEIKYGLFLQNIIDFLIIAFSIFLFVRLMMKFKRKEEPVKEETPAIDAKEELLKEIRDLLKEEKK